MHFTGIATDNGGAQMDAKDYMRRLRRIGEHEIAEYLQELESAKAIAEAASERAFSVGYWQYEIDFEDESARNDFDVICTACGALFSADNPDAAQTIFDHWDHCPICGANMYWRAPDE